MPGTMLAFRVCPWAGASSRRAGREAVATCGWAGTRQAPPRTPQAAQAPCLNWYWLPPTHRSSTSSSPWLHRGRTAWIGKQARSRLPGCPLTRPGSMHSRRVAGGAGTKRRLRNPWCRPNPFQPAGRAAPVQAPASPQALAVHLCRQAVAAQLSAADNQGAGAARGSRPVPAIAAALARRLVGGGPPGVGADQQGTVWLAGHQQVVLHRDRGDRRGIPLGRGAGSHAERQAGGQLVGGRAVERRLGRIGERWDAQRGRCCPPVCRCGGVKRPLGRRTGGSPCERRCKGADLSCQRSTLGRGCPGWFPVAAQSCPKAPTGSCF